MIAGFPLTRRIRRRARRKAALTGFCSKPLNTIVRSAPPLAFGLAIALAPVGQLAVALVVAGIAIGLSLAELGRG